jgi:hypothetical protein
MFYILQGEGEVFKKKIWEGRVVEEKWTAGNTGK